MEFRCHRLWDLMVDGKTVITEKQLQTIEALSSKGDKITQKQFEELNRLIAKKNYIGLSVTTKTYLREMAIYIKYKREKDITSKYFEKGIKVEGKAIMALNQYYGKLYEKNTIRKSNGWLTGEADIVEPTYIRDTKASWDVYSHFAKEELDPKNEWQVRGYMELYNKDTAYVDNVLIDTPEEIIQDELYRAARKLGYQDLPIEIEDKIRHSLTFEDIPLEKRIITFEVKRCQEKTDALYKRLEQCSKELEIILNII